MDIYIKGHKNPLLASNLVPVESQPQNSYYAEDVREHEATGGYSGFTYVDSYSYHICVGQISYIGYSYVPIKISYTKTGVSYAEQTIDIDYTTYEYQLGYTFTPYVSSAPAAGEGENGGENGGESYGGEVQEAGEYQQQQIELTSDIVTRSTTADILVPVLSYEDISYEYNSYLSYSYNVAYLASYSYFHHDWSAYTYTYTYTEYTYDMYPTTTTMIEWLYPDMSHTYDSYYYPYQWVDPNVQWEEGARE